MGSQSTKQRLCAITAALPTDICRHIHDYWLLLGLRVALKKQWARVLTRCAFDCYKFYGKCVGEYDEYGLCLVRLNRFYWRDGVKLVALDVTRACDFDEKEPSHTLLVFDCNYRQLRELLGEKEGAEKIVFVH